MTEPRFDYGPYGARERAVCAAPSCTVGAFRLGDVAVLMGVDSIEPNTNEHHVVLDYVHLDCARRMQAE